MSTVSVDKMGPAVAGTRQLWIKSMGPWVAYLNEYKSPVFPPNLNFQSATASTVIAMMRAFQNGLESIFTELFLVFHFLRNRLHVHVEWLPNVSIDVLESATVHPAIVLFFPVF